MHEFFNFLIITCCIREIFMHVRLTELMTTERSVGLKLFPSDIQPIIDSRKCLDLCHLEYCHYFPCLQQNGKYADNPTIECKQSYCEAENVDHLYEMRTENGTTLWQMHTNRIERTKVGEKAVFRDLCLDSEGFPKRRLCMEQSEWQPLDNLTCYRGSELNTQVNHLINEIIGGQHNQVAELRHELSRWRGQLSLIDVFNIGNMFAHLMDQPQREATLGSELVGICLEVMASSSKVLRLSAKLNATNILLSKFEDYMDTLAPKMVPMEKCPSNTTMEAIQSEGSEVENVIFNQHGVHNLISGNLSVFFVNPQYDNITGIAIYSESSPDLYKSNSGFWYRFLRWNESLEQLRQETNLETATFMPQKLWSSLQVKGANYVVFKVYSYDSLFVETAEQRRRRPHSKILSISLPGMEGLTLPERLPFLLRNENLHQPNAGVISPGSGCGYWNYKTWLSDGVTTSNQGNMLHDPLIVCYAHHLTQFSFLLGASQKNVNLGSESLHYKILDYITIIGCFLSLIGLLGIFVMASLFRKFRESASTKVLLHLCAALTLQMLLFVILNIDEWTQNLSNFNGCLFLGALLHYSVLVVFIWMLIIAFLQYQRYVTVLGAQRPQRYILISSFVAWILPFLAVLSLVLVSPSLYKPHENGSLVTICYPSGKYLLYSVILPIIVITFANGWMVGCIIYSIHGTASLSVKRQRIFQELKLFVLLFFLLGLTWIFGICNYMQFGITFSYLFCLTATLQGFVLFIYFCIINKTNRKLWLSLIAGSSKYSQNGNRAVDSMESSFVKNISHI
ncbi:adhesion G-protein coupled receptor G2-like [Drosophila tropicalis]|uniref:adhesion G-protein coupled receptor G2-like n=1 Tax=Drosophila tropicalis TaxID=46794 RepID=UPI0035AB72A0